jgi:hypothetical protein
MDKIIVYKVSWYESKRHQISHTNMYFTTPEETLWALNGTDYSLGLVRVSLELVEENSEYHYMALSTRPKQT